jgi:hypothetical protein
MLYPLIIQTLANEQLEESRRRAERARRVRQARDENRSAAAPGKRRRRLRLVTLRVAGPATRFPR